MTEKRVSVRLSATGGRQVKAELEGVGEAGARGFGRLSREMEGANARLAVFARRAGVAMAAAAAAIAAAATAMIRSGLQTVDAQAKLAASLDTTVESIQVLERAGDLAGVSMGQVEQAAMQLTRRLSQAAAGTGPAADALDRLRLIWRGLSNQLAVAAAPALEAVADAMAAAARATGPLGTAIRVLFDNLGRLTSYAAGIAALMAGRFVAASIAAAASVRGLAMALVILRGALLRLPLIGLIVAAGELIHWFGRLVRGAGGFGNALSLLGDLAREVWERMKLGSVAMGLAIMANWAEIKAAIAEALQTSLEAVVGFGNAALNSFQGAFEAIKVLWGALPGAIGDFAFQAANALIAGVEAMLNGVGQRINGFLEGINAGLEALGIERRISLIGNLELGRIDNPFAGSAADAGAEARAAFQAAFNSEPIAMPDLGLGAYAEEARGQAEALRATMAGVVEAATAPLDSVAALREAVAASGVDAETGLTGARTAAEGLEDAIDATGEAAGRAGGAGRGAGQALREAADTARGAWEATADAVRAAQERSREIAQGLAQDIVGPIKDALKSGEFTWETFAGAISRIAQNLATRLIDLAFKPIENALINAFSGGGGGGAGGGFFASLFGFARGGAFAGGQELTAFARGGVVNRPTVFPFAKGVGLMGEAGPEAILPLRRGRGGRLGVEMNGDGAAPADPAAQMSTRIINVLDPSVVGDYLATPSGERAILNVIRRNRSALNV
ncbi:phage tail tape measure protein [Paracoccus sp. (in: a-proteobacteria)]|uniref:phage tail tape measure protein n=1 Tax=Paracoccus sp. TaxID=267 RepID=UPI002AFF2185|nr:phage tail tape measure protein [Paracoccus sp. (in: a-proteobacteria)]